MLSAVNVTTARRLGQQWPGLLSLGLILLISLLAFGALAGWGRSDVATELWQEPWFWQLLRFSLWQALLSALFSVVLALPLARALALDSALPGTERFLSWCLLCFVMPSLILITGLVALFGRSGLLTPWLGDSWRLYGLNGILLAHVFLNLPFAVRVLTFQWRSIPPSAWKLAAQLGVTGWQRFRLVEWPVLQGVLPAVAGFIFLLCFNSFAVVLALGVGLLPVPWKWLSIRHSSMTLTHLRRCFWPGFSYSWLAVSTCCSVVWGGFNGWPRLKRRSNTGCHVRPPG